MDITIGFAENEQDRQAIYRLRYEIYIEEMDFGYAADHENRLLTDSGLTKTHLLYARSGDDIVGTLRLQWGADNSFTEEDRRVYDLDRLSSVVGCENMAIMSRFMSRPAYRNTSIPLDLLRAMVEFYLDHGVQLAFLDCRPHLLNLYQSLGYRTYTKTYNDSVAGLLIPLVLVMEDVTRFEQVNSPFLPQFQQRNVSGTLRPELAALLAQPTPVHLLTNPDEQWSSLSEQLFNDQDHRLINIFSGLNDNEIKRLLEKSPIIECNAGDRIISEDGPDSTVFIVLQGCVNIEVGQRIIATESAGSVVGEISFLLNTPRTASVIAASDGVRVLGLRQKVLDELIKSESSLAARLLYNLSRIVAAKLIAGR